MNDVVMVEVVVVEAEIVNFVVFGVVIVVFIALTKK
jgi:hypothetical protein